MIRSARDRCKCGRERVCNSEQRRKKMSPNVAFFFLSSDNHLSVFCLALLQLDSGVEFGKVVGLAH
jgi:hypothetical protein